MSQNHIVELWFPGDGNSHNQCFRVGVAGVKSITMEHESYGDRDERWLVIEQDAVVRKVNKRQVTEIVWALGKTEKERDE